MDSNYNLGGLIARIKTKLDDQEFDTDTITQFLNDAYFDVVGDEEYQFLEQIYKATTQGSDILPLPRNFQSLFTLTAKNEHGVFPLEYMPKEQFFALDKDDGLKSYKYTIFGNQLFYSLPSIENDKTPTGEDKFYELSLYYLAKPLAMTSETDKPLIPYEFGEILVLGALARCEQRRDNFDYAGIYESKMDELVTNMKLRYCPRQLANENRAKLPVIVRNRH
jgi:hypothetical protein